MRKQAVNGVADLVGEDNKEATKHTMDRAMDTVLYGIPGLLGIDASNNIGLGAPFLRYQANRPLSLSDVGGAGMGMATSIGKAAKAIVADPWNPQQWTSAMSQGSPSFLQQMIRMYDIVQDGTTQNASGQPISNPLDTLGSAATVMGFTPVEVTKQRTLNNHDFKNRQRMYDDYQMNVNNISKLIHDFQTTGDSDSLLQANTLFNRYVRSTGGLQDRDSMVESITTQLEQHRGPVTRTTPLKGLKDRQSLESAYPSLESRYSSAVSTAFDELEVARSLGQADVLVRKLSSLPRSLQNRALKDVLVSAGLPPALAQVLLQRRSAQRLGNPHDEAEFDQSR